LCRLGIFAPQKGRKIFRGVTLRRVVLRAENGPYGREDV
jgi:hypothetical protein